MKKKISTYRLNGIGVFLLAIVLSLNACNRDKGTKFAYIERPVAYLYNQAMDSLESGRLDYAVFLFSEVDRQHPYSAWATRALLMGAYAQYLRGDFAEAVADLDRFISLHPGHSNIDYAYYLKALCYYQQMNDIGRDQTFTAQAAENFLQLINRFPDSPYRREAEIKLDISIDQLAGKEMDIGRYYQRNNQYFSAIKRFERVIRNYPTTVHVPEAFYRLAVSYLNLGLVEEAKRNASYLSHNHPQSDWYKKIYDFMGRNGLIDDDTPR